MRKGFCRCVWLWALIFLGAVVAAECWAEDFELGEVVVTAKKGYERNVLSIPANITVITSEDIERSNAQTIPDLLKSEAGVVVRDLFGDGNQASVDMRGFGGSAAMNSLILIDGRRVNNIDMSNPDLTQISLSQIERIEVLRGGAATLYGSGAVGGVINIITKKAVKKNVVAGISFNAFNGADLKFRAGDAIDGISYSINGSYRFSQGYRLHSEMSAGDLGVRLVREEQDSTPGWDLSAGLHSGDYQLPGYIYQTDWDAGYYWKAYTWAGITPLDYANSIDWYSKLSLDKSLSGLKTQTEISLRNRNAESFMDSWGLYNKIYTRILGAGEKLSYDLFGTDLLGGIEYYSNSYNIFPENVTGEPTAGNDDQRLLRLSTAGYIQIIAPLFNVFSLEGGARTEAINQHFVVDVSSSDTFKNEVLNAYYAGLSVKIIEGTNAYIRWSQSFRMPTTDEYYKWDGSYNAGLKPQKSEDVEFGVKYGREKISGEVSFFLMNVYDEIYYHKYNDTFTDPVNKNENYPIATVRRGLEAEIKTQPFDFMEVSCNYTLTEAKLDTGTGIYAGKYIPLVPMHKGNIKLSLALPLGINFAADCLMVSDRWLGSDYTQTGAMLSGYTIVDLNAWKQFDNLRLFGAITNVGDTRYAETAYSISTGAYYPSPVRNFKIGAEMSL